MNDSHGFNTLGLKIAAGVMFVAAVVVAWVAYVVLTAADRAS